MQDFGNGGLGNEGGDGVDVRGQRAVGGNFGGDGADGVVGFFGERAGLQWGKQVNALAGAE